MISKLFINRPIVAMVIAIVTVIGGLVAMAGLPVAQFPEIVPPQIIVSATYTGADAVTIEQSVSTPLEQQMSGVDNMLYMQSTNSNYANINIIDVLYRVPGVGQVRVFGSSDYAMRIWVRPDALSKLGLAIPDLANAVRQQSNVNPSGQIGGEPAPAEMEKTYTVRAQGRLQTPEEFGEIVVRSNRD